MLYVRNLLLSTTEETIEGIFSEYGEVERVKKLRDYCFVHFKTREEARKAINAMKGRIYYFSFTALFYNKLSWFLSGLLEKYMSNMVV